MFGLAPPAPPQMPGNCCFAPSQRPRRPTEPQHFQGSYEGSITVSTRAPFRFPLRVPIRGPRKVPLKVLASSRGLCVGVGHWRYKLPASGHGGIHLGQSEHRVLPAVKAKQLCRTRAIIYPNPYLTIVRNVVTYNHGIMPKQSGPSRPKRKTLKHFHTADWEDASESTYRSCIELLEAAKRLFSKRPDEPSFETTFRGNDVNRFGL